MADVKTIVDEVKKHSHSPASTLKEILVLSPGVEKNKLAIATPDDGAHLTFGELIAEIQDIFCNIFCIFHHHFQYTQLLFT